MDRVYLPERMRDRDTVSPLNSHVATVHSRRSFVWLSQSGVPERNKSEYFRLGTVVIKIITWGGISISLKLSSCLNDELKRGVVRKFLFWSFTASWGWGRESSFHLSFCVPLPTRKHWGVTPSCKTDFPETCVSIPLLPTAPCILFPAFNPAFKLHCQWST